MRRLLPLLVLLAGCGGVPLDETNPANVNLTGTWVVNFNASDVVPDLRNARPERPRRSNNGPNVRREALRIATGSGLAFVAHDFQVLRADRLEIEQNRDSMGVQYTPGQYRDVSWGERQRGLWEVRAGWQEEELVVISEAKDLKVIERMQLLSRERLRVAIYIMADGEEREYTRMFDRR